MVQKRMDDLLMPPPLPMAVDGGVQLRLKPASGEQVRVRIERSDAMELS